MERIAPKMRPSTANNLGGVTLVLGIAWCTLGTACSLALEQITQLDQSNMILLGKGLIRLCVSRDCAVRVPLAIDCSQRLQSESNRVVLRHSSLLRYQKSNTHELFASFLSKMLLWTSGAADQRVRRAPWTHTANSRLQTG